MISDFHYNLAGHISQNDIDSANSVVMMELGRIAVNHRADFIDLLNHSDAPAHADFADGELVKLYMDNVHKKDLLIGSAYLVNMHNKTVSADGREDVSNRGVKSAYRVMSCFYGQMAPKEGGRTTERSEEWKSSFRGLGLGLAAKVGIGLVNNKLKAKSDLSNAMIEQRRLQKEAAEKEKERKSKNLKIGLIIGGGLLVLGLVIYLVKKNK